MSTTTPPIEQQHLVSPFVYWGDRFYGLCVQDEKVTETPDEDKEWTEYHLNYYGGEIWEIEVCTHAETGTIVWRGKIPTREVFVSIMRHIEDAPPIDWAELGHAEAVRLAALKAVGDAITNFGDHAYRNDALLLCHRILANNNAAGEHCGVAENHQANSKLTGPA